MSGFFPEEKVFTVTEISGVIKDMLEGAIGTVTVEGEISNLKTAASGHVYFDLKDGGAVLSAVFFKGWARNGGAELAEGLQVEAFGQISAYGRQSRYQLIVRRASPKTQGKLCLEFEKLKKKLAAEGLFDEFRKRPIPKFPSCIGIVTSEHGAALRDMLSILARRGAGLSVIIAPSLVQGPGAGKDIARAIADLNQLVPLPDVLLVGRGGGSMEDLWAFNEEIVARAIAASKIPVISCVGHETDFTIADFTADLRAPTPSAAAELVVKNRQDVLAHVSQLERRLGQSLRLFYSGISARYGRAARLPDLITAFWRERSQETDRLAEKLHSAMRAAADGASRRLELAAGKLSTLAPKSVLSRGYAIVRKSGAILTDAAQSSAGDRVEVELRKGKLDCEVKTAI
ncbi:MAG: exodeoxyribonuclease VII large subunit [Elusimicrobiales bacterium]